MGRLTYKVKAMTNAEIKSRAVLIRKLLSDGNAPWCPIGHILENGMYNLFEDYEFEVVEDEALPEAYAETVNGLHHIRMRESTYDALWRGDGRARFTGAHELGHLFMHSSQRLSMADAVDSSRIPHYMSSEYQADEFAREFLAPHYIVKGFTLREIINRCGVSMEVAEIIWRNDANRLFRHVRSRPVQMLLPF